jgi:hypothetical protein
VAGRRRRRLEVELTLGALSGALFALTLVWPDWIEVVFRVDPDGGNGALEFLVAGTFLALSLVAGRLARRALHAR